MQSLQQEQEQGGATSLLKMYNSAFKSKASARAYTYVLNKYAGENKIELDSLLNLNQKEAEDKLIQFIITNKDKGMNWGALHNYVAAVVKFYSINDVELNVNRIKRFMPEPTTLKKDRAYETSEIQSVLNLCTERMRALILLLCSSGCRLGAIAEAKISDLEDRGDIYKITFYPNTKQEYFSYCSAEARAALDTYFSIRRRHGETIDFDFAKDNKTPIIREQYMLKTQ